MYSTVGSESGLKIAAVLSGSELNYTLHFELVNFFAFLAISYFDVCLFTEEKYFFAFVFL